MSDNKILESALAFAETHKSIYTGFIHYKNEREVTRDVIPLVENVLYGIALVTTFSKERAEKGLAFLERLFHFCTEDGFVSYVHDFPQVYNDRANVDICLCLSYFLKNYAKVIPSSSRLKIESMREKLVSILQKRDRKRPLAKMDAFLFKTALFESSDLLVDSLPEYERLVLCKLLMGERVTLAWHPSLNVYTGPLVESYYKGHLPAESLISQIAKGGSVHRSALFAALLPKSGWRDLVTYEREERDDLFVNHRGDDLAVYFGKHSFVAKGAIDLVVSGDHIDITIGEFEEMEFFFTDYKESEVLVDGQKATAFYPEDTLTLITAEKSITVRFIAKNHPFMGHIMKGNRGNQILDQAKNFALYDHKILLKETLNNCTF
ncbi:MAG: hypothetical protein SP4CHLAM5_03310 [Chlamydiia bacterium]|nr:hypothetical protein [Chlamydiia bacterium]MCH9618205.1 hypothetical protein [Chlamydiia bacterium]MCH9624072.1 hypothetical protein [Chlamydiia bacterium]